MVSPWVSSVFQSKGADTLDVAEEDSMSDIQYLAVKEFDSKLRTNEGAVTTTGTLATLTAATGKDMYLASAKVNLKRSDIAVVGQADLKVELQMNAVVIETWDANVIWNTDLVNISNDYEFKIGIGKKVLAGQVIRLEVISNTGNDADVEGAISCFEENTGSTPRLASQSIGSVTVTAGQREGETETLFPAADRLLDSVATAEFDMKGAEFGVFVQEGNIVDNNSRVAFGTPVTWTAQDQADVIDGDLTNGVERNPTTSSEMKHDWGSIATRSISAKGNVRTVSLNPANSIVMTIDFSDDDVAYANPQTIGSTGGAVNSVNFDTDLTAQSFRFTRIRPSVQANSTRATVDEMWEKTQNGGASNLTFEVFDTAQSDWKVLATTTPLVTVAPNTTGAQFNVVTQLGEGQTNQLVMPSATTGSVNLIRAVLTTTAEGVSNTSVVLLKTNITA